MIIFYTSKIENSVAYLQDEEARHCSKVLRKRVGDTLRLTDGKGHFYEGELVEISKKFCKVNIAKKWQESLRDYELTIAISIQKNMNRFEWFLEKSIEIGIDKIVPLICSRTEKRKMNMERMQKILIAAAKQSLKAKFPVLTEPIAFNEYIQSLKGENNYIGALFGDTPQYLGKAIKSKGNYTIIIGPEGDFTEEELQKAVDFGVKPVSLGKPRFRVETAGVVATQIVNTINEMGE